MLKPQVLKNQALLKQQVLKNQQGLCHLLAFAAAAATIVLSNLHMLCNLHVKSMSAGSKVELQHQWAIVQTCKRTSHRSTWTICQRQVFAAPASLPVLSPADAKAAAAKAKADPKAAAAAAAEAAAALAAVPLQPCSLLSPALAAQLNPVIFTPCKVLHLHICPTA